MMLKGLMSRTLLQAGFLALDLSLVLYLGFPPTTGHVSSREPQHTQLPRSVGKTETTILRSVHFGDRLVLPVVQQPGGGSTFVSKQFGEVTQFSSASQYGNIGLLAHNYLSGGSFFQLELGEEVHLEYIDGSTEIFIVSEILRYQALEPKDPFSSFRNLRDENEILSTAQMVERAYGGSHHVTFQTCIEGYGNPSWGRLFVIATPKSDLPDVQ